MGTQPGSPSHLPSGLGVQGPMTVLPQPSTRCSHARPWQDWCPPPPGMEPDPSAAGLSWAE